MYRIVQEPGQYVILPPGIIHWGFNSGENVAESTNFASSNHPDEIKPTAGYHYMECRSGKAPEPIKDFPNKCIFGFANNYNIAMISRQFMCIFVERMHVADSSKRKKVHVSQEFKRRAEGNGIDVRAPSDRGDLRREVVLLIWPTDSTTSTNCRGRRTRSKTS